ncbi:MAG: thioredoxin family protein [Rhodobacteraceae bacterium]|uniref:thioredoxin family protein n=1 Tax=Accumulibacter sp. TaxID=2053492 RepID=UPI0019DDEFBB|nr:thioredoxin family protein [Accumulibacter sp.]MBE2260518.1 thioredoxin family protein [Paracoccaceae bacterium]MCB1943440.1 thioredoxin family protein [Accumulibacter sp.]
MALQTSNETEPSRVDIDALEEPTLIEFGAVWCGYCVAARPSITLALAAHPRVRHIRVEDGPGRRLGRSFRVKLWPTLIFLSRGKEIERLVRPADAAVIKRALARLEPTA